MKNPSWNTPLILAATLAIVGSGTYWLQFSYKPKHDRIEGNTRKPLALPSEDTQIVAFKIKSVRGLIEGKCEELAKKNCKVGSLAQWTITYPQTLKADDEGIKTFINDAANVSAIDMIDLTEETPEKRTKLLDEYGLSPDKRTNLAMQFVEFQLENGKRLTAWFGQEHPLGDKTFVARSEDGVVNDKNIYLISNFFKSNFDKSLTYFRDKKLFNFDRSAIDSIDAKTTFGKLNAKLASGKWTINGEAGDYDRIETLLSAIAQLKAIEFPQPSIIKGMKPIVTYDLGEKDKHYTLSLYEKTLRANPRPADRDHHDHEDGDEHDREPGSLKSRADRIEEKHYYAVVSGNSDVVEVQALILSQIDKTLNELRYGNLLSQAEKVTTTQVKFEGPEYHDAVQFDFKAGSWTSASKIDGNNIPKLFDILTGSRVKDFVKTPNAKHVQDVTLSMGDDKNPARSHFQIFTVMRGKEELVYAIDLTGKKNEAMELESAIFKNSIPFSPEVWKAHK
jgi:hypothetical protein